MTVKEYISSKFQSFGIQVSEADLLDMSLNARVNIEDDVDADVIDNQGLLFSAVQAVRAERRTQRQQT